MKFLTFLLLVFLFPHPISAQEATPSAIDNKIEDVKGILQQIVKGVSTEQTTPAEDSKPKSFFGTITQINEKQITINYENQNKVIQTDDETTFVDSKRQKSDLDKFKVGQTILTMGYLNPDSSMDCRRIVATDTKSVENNNQIVTGQIVDVSQSQSSSIFVLIPFQNKNGQYQIKIDSKTEFTDSDENKIKSSEIITSGKKIIAVIQPDTKIAQTFYAIKIISLEKTESQSSASE